MAKRKGRRGIGWRGILALAIATAFPVAGHPSSGPGQVAVGESRPWAEAEQQLALGRIDKASRLYRDAFSAATGFDERLALIGPMARVLLVDRELADWLREMEGPVPAVADWEEPVLRAAVYQFLGDLSAADDELAGTREMELPGELRKSFLEQRRAWAETVADWERVLSFYRDGLPEVRDEGGHAGFVRTLIRTGARAELSAHVKGRLEKLAPEAEFWRPFLPDLKEEGLLDLVAVHFEKAWKANAADPVVLFALAELRLFQQRTDEAEALFWTLFEMNEETGQQDQASTYFRRLNAYVHNRFPVKYRIDQALGRYGSNLGRDFLLFGFDSDVQVRGGETARDLALFYLRELKIPAQPTGLFLDRVGEALDRADQPAGLRILAFAGLGAPRAMLEEVAAFVDSEANDDAAAEFSLQAMNRYLLSSKKFPQLLQPLADLTRAMDSKFAADASGGLPPSARQFRERILSRLGEEPGERDPGAESRQEYFQRIGRAVEAGNPAEAERLFREMRAEEPGEDLGAVLLFLAGAWQGEQGDENAAALVAEFLEPIYAVSGGGGLYAPLQWNVQMPFPPPSPFLGETGLEMLQQAFETVGAKESGRRLKQILAHELERDEGNRAGRLLVLASLHWWSGEADAAVDVLRAGVDGTEGAEFQVLFAYLLGLHGERDQGRKVLEQVAAAGSGEASEAARRLLFAFAVAEGDAERIRERARDLADVIELAREKVEIAASLVGIGDEAEAGGWLERVAPANLTGPEREFYQGLRLRVLMAGGESDRAVAQARLIQLGDPVDRLPDPGDGLRRAALGVLEQTEEIARYQEDLERLLVLAPKSLSLHLLLGEVVDFQADRPANRADERGRLRGNARDLYQNAVTLRPDDVELRLDFCEWLGRSGFEKEAVVEYRTILKLDVQLVLLDFNTVLNVFGRAGELPWLVDFFAEWEVPEARTVDDFYGLQPTEHILRPLGEALLAQGDRLDAARAWENGLKLNPIGFTEELRLALARLYHEERQTEALIELLKGYVAEENADIHLYAIQPFFDVAPRWIQMANAARDLTDAPVNQLVSLAEQRIGEIEMGRLAEEWRAAMPDRLSVVAFSFYLAARAQRQGWKEELVEAKARLTTGDGPIEAGWPAVEALLNRVTGSEGEQ